MRQLQHVAVLGRFLENVALAADIADQRHHHLFANGIDWRIRHLGEELLEVIEQRLRLIGQAGERRIRAHGTDWLFTLRCHRRQNHLADLHRYNRKRVAGEAASRRSGKCMREGSGN